MRKLGALGCDPRPRVVDHKQYVTDNGNYIVDCDFGIIERPGELHHAIHTIPGVVDNGLFIGMADKVIVGYKDGSVQELRK
jgi:ribose 5-phosphate isomerase A